MAVALTVHRIYIKNSGIQGGKVHESGHMAFYPGSSHLGRQLPYLEAQLSSHLASLPFTSTAGKIPSEMVVQERQQVPSYK